MLSLPLRLFPQVMRVLSGMWNDDEEEGSEEGLGGGLG